MAKKRKSKTSHPPKRDFQPIANRPARLLKVPRLSVLTPIEDFRVNSFPLTRARAYRIITTHAVTPRSVPYKNLYPRVRPLHRVARVLPREAVVCVRRSVRREVMFATGRGGRRGSQRPHRRNETSAIHCRRR